MSCSTLTPRERICSTPTRSVTSPGLVFPVACGFVRLAMIDRDMKVMDVEARGRRTRRAPMTFEIAKDATITVGRQPADLSSVQAGDRVFITFENRDGRNIATRVSTLGLRMALAGANPA